jgi:hypothetical protein
MAILLNASVKLCRYLTAATSYHKDFINFLHPQKGSIIGNKYHAINLIWDISNLVSKVEEKSHSRLYVKYQL